jgi:hypothetical protein
MHCKLNKKEQGKLIEIFVFGIAAILYPFSKLIIQIFGIQHTLFIFMVSLSIIATSVVKRSLWMQKK